MGQAWNRPTQASLPWDRWCGSTAKKSTVYLVAPDGLLFLGPCVGVFSDLCAGLRCFVGRAANPVIVKTWQDRKPDETPEYRCEKKESRKRHQNPLGIARKES